MHFSSMSLGIFDWLIGAITNLVGMLVGWVFDIVNGIVNRSIFNVVKSILFIVDWVQLLFRRLSGLDKYWVSEGGFYVEKEGDMLMDLMLNQTVLQVLLALSLVAVAMVIMATIIKIVQSEFTTEGSKNSKGSIIATALKSLTNFVLIPVLCVGGVWLSNMLLKALDNATSLGGSQSMASQIFVAASSNANRARTNTLPSNVEGWLDKHGLYVADNPEQTAVNIDMMFRQNMQFDSAPPASLSGIVDTVLTTLFGAASTGIAGGLITTVNGVVGLHTASYENLYFVTTFYDIGLMNMVILLGGAIMAVYVMITTAFGLVMRLFKAVILFMISPPIVAIAPLDKGNALGSWRKQFLSEVFATYGSVIGLNLFFIVLPIINNINLFWGLSAGGYGGSIYNDLAHLLFTIVGMYMLKDIVKMISGLAGGSDAMGAGEGMAKKAVSTAAKVAVTGAAIAGTVMTGGAAAGAIGLAGKMAASKGGAMLAKAATKKGMAKSLTNKAKAGKMNHARLEKKMKSGKQLTPAEQKLFDETTDDKIQALQDEADGLMTEASGLEERGNKWVARGERSEGFLKKRQDNPFLRTMDGFGRQAVAQTLGAGFGKINGLFGTKFNDKTTISEREKFADTQAEEAADRWAKGEGTLMDTFIPGRRQKLDERDAAYQRGAQSTGASTARGAALGGSAKDMGVKINNLDGLADAIAQAMKHMNNDAEGEQSQQIWRSMYEQLKAIADMKNNGDTKTAEAMLAQLNTDRDKSKVKIEGLQNENKIMLEVQQTLSGQTGITADSVKKAVEDAMKHIKPSATKEEIAKMQETLLTKMKDEIDKITPK